MPINYNLLSKDIYIPGVDGVKTVINFRLKIKHTHFDTCYYRYIAVTQSTRLSMGQHQKHFCSLLKWFKDGKK